MDGNAVIDPLKLARDRNYIEILEERDGYVLVNTSTLYMSHWVKTLGPRMRRTALLVYFNDHWWVAGPFGRYSKIGHVLAFYPFSFRNLVRGYFNGLIDLWYIKWLRLTMVYRAFFHKYDPYHKFEDIDYDNFMKKNYK